jgi:hypothetical protein
VPNAIALDANAARGVALRVGVDEQRLPLRGRKRGGEVHGGRRFSDTAFLIGDRDYA